MIIALDVGTSSARASLYDTRGASVDDRFHQVAYSAMVTQDGGVEHEPATLLDAAADCIDRVCHELPRGAEVLGVAVTTFWHGLLGFDARNRPVTPVFMWADSRSAPDAALLKAALDLDEDALHARTGCHLHASYWPAKLRWLARERPGETRGVARWGSFGEHLEATLFGEAATSVSMASGTGLFDTERSAWDPTALAAAGIDAGQLFAVRDRAEPRRGLRGPWAQRWPALRQVPWFPAVGDGAAGNVGSGCVDLHGIALNVGTSAALRIMCERTPPPPRGLWRYSVDRRRAMLGGATSEGGNVHAWCRDVLSLPEDAALEAALAAEPADGHGLTVLPFLAGERAPGWRGGRRATITGLSLHTTAVQIVRAALESVALRLALVYDLLAPHAAADHVIVASGGAITRSRVWTQMIADACGRPVTWSRETEATSRGAALLALQALGSVRELGALRAPLGETFAPDAARHARYREALARQRRLDDSV
jgi:gluconokinase